MTNKKRLRKNLKRFSNSTEQPLKFYSGALGIFIGGRQYVDVPNRPGFVYVRLRNNISELIQAHNQLVSPVYDLPVLVVRGNNYYEIYSRDTQQYTSYWDTQSSFLPRHGFQHEFDPANNGGGDLVFVHGEQFYPLMGFPSGTDGAGNILIAPYRYYANSAWHYAGDTGTSNLLTHRPTGSANAKLLLIGLTVDTGNPFVKVGTEFAESITGAAALTQYVPTSIDVNEEIPGTIVRLVTGTASITWANIYDARQYMGILQAAAVTGAFGGSFLQLNDTPDSYAGQTEKIVAVNNAGTGLEFRTNTGSSGATTFLALTDTPDSYSGEGNKFVAVNAGATGLEFVNSPAGVGGSGIVVLDNSVYKVTGTAISFDTNLSVAITGSTAYVSASGGRTLISEKLPAGTGTASFTGIPSTYTNLFLEIVARSTVAATFTEMNVELNGDSTDANYRYITVFAYGATSSGVEGGDNNIFASTLSGNTAPANSFSHVDMKILQYKNTIFNKHIIIESTHRRDVSSVQLLRNIGAIEWESTDAISRIDCVLASGNYVTGSVLRLYGE